MQSGLHMSFVFSLAVLMLVPHSFRGQEARAGAGAQKSAPMAGDALPSFEVATVRPSDPNDPNAAKGWSFESEGHRITCKGATILNIVQVMYGVQSAQIVGGPDWMKRDRFDISGVPDLPGDPDTAQIQAMYRRLLAERFSLKLHHEMRVMPVYALTVAKGGPFLKVADPSEAVNTGNLGDSSQRTLRFTNMSMREFAKNMDVFADRPVVDNTLLPGRYDFTLKWTFEVSAEGRPGAPPSLFEAMKEQLGLRMDAAKGPSEVIVIDQVEKPSEN